AVSTAQTSFFFRFFTAVDYKMGSPTPASRGKHKNFLPRIRTGLRMTCRTRLLDGKNDGEIYIQKTD
ncbi:hypothetical protein ACPQUH_21050, partial [Klebsiella pneumoniae]